MLTWIKSWLPEKIQMQAQIELESAKVQAIEGAPTGQHLLQALLSHSISLFLFIRLDPVEDKSSLDYWLDHDDMN